MQVYISGCLVSGEMKLDYSLLMGQKIHVKDLLLIKA